MTRYARQTILPEVGADGQRRIAAAHVLVVGAGGLAAMTLPLLAGAGAGRITVIDGDVVNLSNLHRQTLFAESDNGKPKARVAAKRCRGLNSEITVEAIDQVLTPTNAPALVAQADIVLDCADSYAASYILSDVCHEQGRPFVSASALGLGGHVGGYCGGAPGLRSVFPHAPESGANCATAGVLGPVVGIIGAFQAQMTLAVLLGMNPSPLGQFLQVDARTLRFASFRFDNAPDPETAFRFMAPEQFSNRDFIVDLRDADEAPRLIHPNACRIASEDLARHLPEAGTRLALCCSTGLRSWRAAERGQSKWAGEIVLAAAATS